MNIPIYVINSFTNSNFEGNPAGVCILNEELDECTMQKIAKELKFSETAFLLAYKDNIYSIRWFTPEIEVNLCGHATLAASYVLFNEIKIPFDNILYSYNNGVLKAINQGEYIELDFPSDEPKFDLRINIEKIQNALGINGYDRVFVGEKTKKIIFHLDSEEKVRMVRPDFNRLKNIDITDFDGVGITSASTGEYDFVTRYFNPWAGVDEDYVTGSVHTLLVKYWQLIKGKSDMTAKQLSQREGELNLKLLEDGRVGISGRAKLFLKGEIYL